MKRYIAYFKYLFRHKWYVCIACRKFKLGIIQSVFHDWTKFLPSLWRAYAYQFFNRDGTRRSVRNADGSYDPNAQAVEFQLSWMIHQREKHHWQAWNSIGDKGLLSPQSIPLKYILEMIADWEGAGKAISGIDDPTAWYLSNRHKMIIKPSVRENIERLLGIWYKL